MYVYVPYIEYGRTHKHSIKCARQAHRKIRNNKAEPAYSRRVVPSRSGPTVLFHVLREDFQI